MMRQAADGGDGVVTPDGQRRPHRSLHHPHEELVIGRRLPQHQPRLHILSSAEDADDHPMTSDSFDMSPSSAYTASSPPPVHQHKQSSELSSPSDSSSDDLMRLTAYESMLASQQWTQQRAAARGRTNSRTPGGNCSPQHIPTHRVLTPWGLLALSFFICCGGPGGTEPFASAGGPLLGLVAQIAFPLLLNIPILLAIAELATAFPNDGGYSVWVLNAFGPFWGFQVGFWSWVASIFDRVVYMQFLFDKLSGPLGYSGDQDTGSLYFNYGVEYAIKAGAAILLSIPALFCTKSFIRVLYVLLAVVVACTAILSGWGFSQTQSLSVFGETQPDEVTIADHFDGTWKINWTAYVGVFWYYDGFYLATVFGGEVAKPHKTYPLGLKWGFALTWLTYLLPMLALVGASAVASSASSSSSSGSKAPLWSWSLFEEDAYPEIARAFGGQTLYAIALVGVVAGTMGMYMAELFCMAYQMRGMAENDLLPAIFMKRHPKYGTPRLSIYFSTLVTLAVLTTDLSSVCGATDALSGLVELFIIVTAVRLRQTQPFVARSFKIPGGVPGMCAVLLLPALMLCYQVVNQLRDLKNALVLVGIALVGVFCSLVCVWIRNKRQQKSARMFMMTMTTAPAMMLSADDLCHDDSTVFIR